MVFSSYLQSTKVAPDTPAQFQLSDALSQNQTTLESASQATSTKTSKRKKLHGLVFVLNISWMMTSTYLSIFYIFAPLTQQKLQMRGKLAALSLAQIILVSLPIFYYLTTFKQLLKMVFLIDTIMVASLIAAIVFVNMIMIFDKGKTWYFPMIEAAFSSAIIFASTMTRVMLAHMEWKKWQLIFFKLHLITSSLTFFLSGVYFIFVDFTYTNHMLKSFDDKAHEFMVLFIFTMFGWVYELYNKVTDFDYTGSLKFVYMIKLGEDFGEQKKISFIREKKKTAKTVRFGTCKNLVNESERDERRRYGTMRQVIIGINL